MLSMGGYLEELARSMNWPAPWERHLMQPLAYNEAPYGIGGRDAGLHF